MGGKIIIISFNEPLTLQLESDNRNVKKKYIAIKNNCDKAHSLTLIQELISNEILYFAVKDIRQDVKR